MMSEFGAYLTDPEEMIRAAILEAVTHYDISRFPRSVTTTVKNFAMHTLNGLYRRGAKCLATEVELSDTHTIPPLELEEPESEWEKDPRGMLDRAVERGLIDALDREILLRTADGERPSQMAPCLGLSAGAVRWRLCEARKRLQAGTKKSGAADGKR
jgi:DNA-directed RNA polymerase specialized sigma24 family protein